MRMEPKISVSKTLITSVLGWLAIGALSLIATTLIYQPPSPIMGVANSPARLAYWYQYVLLIELPLSILFIYWFTRKEEWRAPPGKYVPERHYPMFTTYTLSAVAVLAALYAGLGFVVGVTNIDLVATVTAFGASFFGPLVAFVSVFVGVFIRFVLGGLPWLNPAALLAFAVSDASRWAINGYIIWIICKGVFPRLILYSHA